MAGSTLDDQRAALRGRVYDAASPLRILLVGLPSGSLSDGPACLRRAMERIGHAVFFVDLREWSTAEPDGASERMAVALDRFAPDLVVIFDRPLDAPSAHEAALRGVRVVELYARAAGEQLGVADEAAATRLIVAPYPDQDLVTREPVRPATLTADLATFGPRPEGGPLADVLEAVAESFTLTAQGPGWAGKQLPHGEDLLALARAVPVHVVLPPDPDTHDDPRTALLARVCWSAGLGAAVLAPAGSHLEEAFDDGTEILLYDGPDQLDSQVRAILADPDRRDRIRTNAFARVVRDHLLEDEIDRVLAPLAAGLARRGRPRTVVISGYFGAANRGDDILVATLAAHVQAHVPDAHVVIAATDPRQVERKLGLPAFDKADPDAVASWAARASAVVLGPGGLWQDYSIARADGVMGLLRWSPVSPAHLAQLPLAASVHGAHFHVAGMGVGPLADPEARAVVRFTGDLARSVSVRDETSRELLVGIDGWTRPVEVAPDLAYAAELSRDRHATAQRAPYLAVNVRPWPYAPETADAVLDTAHELATEYGLALVGVPMQPSDAVVMRDWATRRGVAAEIVTPDMGDDVFVEVLAGARAVLAMRLHTSLFAHRLGRPAVGVAYDPKVEAHFAELGRGAFAVTVPLVTGQLAAAVRRALDEPALPADARDVVTDLEGRAEASLRTLATRLAGSPVRHWWPPRIESGRTARAARYGLSTSTGTQPPASVDLVQGAVSSGNVAGAAHAVPVVTQGEATRTFYMDVRAPRGGDFAMFALPLRGKADTGSIVEVEFRCAYPQRTEMRGRIAVQLLVGGEPVVEVDIADGHRDCTLWAKLPSSTSPTEVGIRVLAARDLEDWGWGKAARVTLVRVGLRDAADEGAAWGSSHATARAVPDGSQTSL